MAKRFLSALTTQASTTASAGLQLPHGTAPSAPTDGDVWTTTAGLYVRINGSTVGPLSTGVTDHGALGGLSDDDHPQYAALAQNETVSGNWTFQPGSGAAVLTVTGVTDSYFDVNSPAGEERYVRFKTAGSTRWTFGATPAAEGGGNAGSDFSIARWSDAGAWIDNPLQITRSSGVITAATLLSTAATSTSSAGLRLPHGTAPSAPTNGDLWTTTTGAYVHINGTTVGPLASSANTVNLTGNQTVAGIKTFSSEIIAPAATASIPSIRLPHGTAPSAPTNGDLWTTTAGAYVRINGTTVGPLASSADTVNLTGNQTVAGIKTFSSEIIAPAATASIPSVRLPHGTAPSAPTNGDVWTTTAGIYVRINGSTLGPLASSANTVNLTGDQTVAGIKTFSSHVIAPAATTSIPSIRMPHGAAPSAPTNGDVWTTTGGVYVQINGSTVGPLASSANTVNLTGDQTVAGIKTFSSHIIAPAATTSIPSIRMPHGSAPSSPTNGDVWTTTVAPFVRINGVTKSMIEKVIPFAKAGTLTTGAGVSRLYVEEACTIKRVRASVNTAPTGATILVDINKNGTTIFTTQGNRPSIAISGFTSGAVTNMDVTSLAAGDYLTVDIDQIGSTIAGADLVVTIWIEG